MASNALRTNGTIDLRPMRADDLPRFAQWLARAHVRQWWSGYDAPPTLAEVTADYGPRIDDAASPVRPYFAWLDDAPIGWCQSYRAVACAADGWWADETDPGVFGIDQFIADAERLGQGLGTRMVAAFAAHVFAQHSATRLQTDPHPDNARAIRCYKKAGFRRVREIVTPDGPALLMNLSRC